MNWNRIEGQLKQARGRLREQWGRLTGDHLEVIAGRHDKLLGALQANHGLARGGGATGDRENSGERRRIARENADLIGR